MEKPSSSTSTTRHYDGAAQAAQFVDDWTTLKGRIDPALYADMLPRLQYQAGHAIVWRDAVVQYFLKLSGIPDEHGRAGHYPNRLEAEDARLTGYKVIEVNPWEDASGGKAVSCGDSSCSAEWTYNGAAGRFNIAVSTSTFRAAPQNSRSPSTASRPSSTPPGRPTPRLPDAAPARR